jgi:hypothetical protein
VGKEAFADEVVLSIVGILIVSFGVVVVTKFSNVVVALSQIKPHP